MRISEESWISSLSRLLVTELGDYPGRLSLVARMVISCTLVMAIIMIFRMPSAALGAYFPLFMPRDSLRSTWRAVSITALVSIVGTLMMLLGAMLFAASPLAHCFWSIGSIFVVFYFTSASTVTSAAVGLGLLVVNGISIWDGALSANTRVSLTLYMLLSVLVGCAVTVIVEILFAHTHPSEMVTAGIRERLALVRELLQTYAANREQTSLLRHRLSQYARRGTGQLHEVLARSVNEEEHRGRLSTALSLSGELMELASNLSKLNQHPSEDDLRRIESMATVLVQIETHLEKGETTDWIELPDSFRISHTMPSLSEIERNIDLIADVLAGDSSQAVISRPRMVSGVFTEDAFQSRRHIRFAVRGTLSAAVCYFAYLSVGWKGLNASVVTCFLTALTSVGMSRQKQLLRLLGVFVGGCILGIGSQAFVLPHIETLPAFAVVFAICTFLCAWVAASGPRLAYGGLQMALAYDLVNLTGFSINTSLVPVRDVLLGIFLGLAMMWLIYDHLWALSSVSALRILFVQTIRRIGDLSKIAAAPEGRLHRLALEKEQIDRNFEDLQSFSDSLIFEPHVKDEGERTLVRHIREWQPELQALSQIQHGLLRHTIDGPMLGVSGKACAKASQTLEQIALRLEGKAAGYEHDESFPDLLVAIESLGSADDRSRTTEMRLSHSLLTVTRDIHIRGLGLPA